MIKLNWYSGDLVIENPNDEIKKVLSYQHKSLVDIGWGERETRKEKVDLWEPCKDVAGAIVTFHGLLDPVVNLCKKNKHQHEVIDRRNTFPKPQIKLCHGLRPYQYALFLKFVAFGRSGIMKAPTRWGKTGILANLMAIFPGIKTVLAAPGVSLLDQLVLDLRKWLPDREINGVFTGSKHKHQSEDITVCSMDSLEKMDTVGTKLVLIDEPHASVSPSRWTVFNSFKNARFYGVGATLTGRFDQADILITGIIGPVLVERTFKEAVAEKAICNIEVIIVRVKFKPWDCHRRDGAYRELMIYNTDLEKMIQQICTTKIPLSWQTLIFIAQKVQADRIQPRIPDSVVAVASRMKNKERKQVFKEMADGETKRTIATSIYAQGVTFPKLRVIINAAGGGGSITGTQKPGRLAQIQPGKRCGFMIDFLFVPDKPERAERAWADTSIRSNEGTEWEAVVRDCHARIKTYNANGYTVKYVDRVDDIQLV